MADDLDASALLIAIDLVEQGGMPDEAAVLRRLVRSEAARRSGDPCGIAGERLRTGDALRLGRDGYYYRLASGGLEAIRGIAVRVIDRGEIAPLDPASGRLG